MYVVARASIEGSRDGVRTIISPGIVFDVSGTELANLLAVGAVSEATQDEVILARAKGILPAETTEPTVKGKKPAEKPADETL